MLEPDLTASIITMQAKGNGSGYQIAMDGYGMNWWRLRDIVVKIDQSVPIGEPKADFSVKTDGKPNDMGTITVSFNNRGEAQKILKNESVKINGE